MDRNKGFYCPKCKFMFSQKYLLDKHMKSHVKFQSNNVNDNTSSSGNELLETHSELSKSDLSCPQCNFRTSRQSSLTNHIRKHNGENKTCAEAESNELSEFKVSDAPLLSCIECNFTTNKKVSLSNHIRKHKDGADKASSQKELIESLEPQKCDASKLFCSECDFSTSRQSSLTTHIRMHTKQNMASTEKELIELTEPEKSDASKFSCPRCDFKSSRKSSLTNHIRSHNDNKETKSVKEVIEVSDTQKSDAFKLFCTKCDFSTCRQSALTNHIRKHNDGNKSSIERKLFEQSELQKSDASKLSCPQCDFKTSKQSSLTNHVRMHNGEYKKTNIEKGVIEPSGLLKKDASKLSCLQCNFRTCRQSSLSGHICKHTNGNDQTSIEKELVVPSEPKKSDSSKLFCTRCDFTTGRKSSLSNHICKHNDADRSSTVKELIEPTEPTKSSASKLVCPQCDYITCRQSCLTNHIKKHNRKKPLKCNQCGKEYERESYLNAHLVNCLVPEQGKDIQTDTETFACTECDFICTSNGDLKDHEHEHDMATLLLCQLCNAECRGKSAIKAHMAAHTEKESIKFPPKLHDSISKSYRHSINTKDTNNNLVSLKSKSHTCNNCGKKFLSLQHLKWHLITHSNKKYYNCLDCDFKTIYERSLKIHRKQHLGNNLNQLTCSECDFKTNIQILLSEHINNHKEKRLKLKSFRNNSKTSELSLECTESLAISTVCASLCQPLKHKEYPANNVSENIEINVQSHLGEESNPSNIKQKNTNIRATKEVLEPLENTSLPLTCEVKECNETFISQRSLRKHIQSHKIENMHKCNLCSYKSYSKFQLKRHKINHRPHNCTECDFRCTTLKELKVHKKVHRAEIEVLSFKKSQPKYHKKSNKRVGDMRCDQCKSVFFSNLALQKHQRACKKRKLFKCDLCDYKNVQSYNLVIHKEKQHGQSRLKCDMCSFKTLVAKKLEAHKVVHNVMAKETSQIVKKGNKSDSDCILAVPMACVDKMHTKSDKDCISSVPKACVDKMRTNMTKRPFRVIKSKSKSGGKYHNLLSKALPNINGKITCSECNFTFETKAGLYKHIKTHYGENTFSCSKCPYKTHYSYNLKLHLEIHKFSRLLCLVCDYKCEKLIDLNNHMIEKHNLVQNTNTKLPSDNTVKEEIEIRN